MSTVRCDLELNRPQAEFYFADEGLTSQTFALITGVGGGRRGLIERFRISPSL